jgi:hypothetical protein
MDRLENQHDERDAGQVDAGDPGEGAAASGESERHDEAVGDHVKASWEQRTRFKINDEMLKILDLAKKASESEIKSLRSKVERLTYGS